MAKVTSSVERGVGTRYRGPFSLLWRWFGLLMAATLTISGPSRSPAGESVRLTFVESFRVYDRDARFTEPSGLAMAVDCSYLWAVSDETKQVFRLGLDGKVLEGGAIPLPADQMEGIAVSPDGSRVLLAREKDNEILVVDIASGQTLERRRLSELAGWEQTAALFEGSPKNKGLEGIAVDPATGEVLVLKEGEPRLLIRISPRLDEIMRYHVLNKASGFTARGVSDKRLDVSGIAHNPIRGLFWVVSDQGREIYIMDGESGRATHSPLLATVGGEEGEVKSAEGVAFCASTGRLYVISDDGKSSRLFIYRVE